MPRARPLVISVPRPESPAPARSSLLKESKAPSPHLGGVWMIRDPPPPWLHGAAARLAWAKSDMAATGSETAPLPPALPSSSSEAWTDSSGRSKFLAQDNISSVYHFLEIVKTTFSRLFKMKDSSSSIYSFGNSKTLAACYHFPSLNSR